MNDNDPKFAEDLLRGARAIALFLYGHSDDKTRRKIFHLSAKSNFPCFKLGSMICARKSVLVGWVQQQEARHRGDDRMQK